MPPDTTVHMHPFLILGVLVVIGVLTVVALFNKCIALRNKVFEAWSGIDVQLKRRHDLIPPLVETVKGYQLHERNTLVEITRARSTAVAANGAKEASPAESHLSKQIHSLFALAEAYPDLKADVNFHQLTSQLVEIERHLQYARRYYNGAVRDLNNLLQSFPANLLTSTFGFQTADFFEVDSAAERQNPQVKL